jgi:hypothetical protein
MSGGWPEAPVCVLGMGRSGTSLTTRVLNLLGVDLGPEEGLIGGSPSNSRGYWERHAILELNDVVLRAMGGDYANPPQLEPGWQRSPVLGILMQRARDLVDDCFAGRDLWGFKEPRTCFTLAFWRDVLPEMRYVICVRNPAEVSASLGRYPGFEFTDDAHCERLWFRSIAGALVETSGSPRMLIFYEDYFCDLRRQIDRLAAFIGRPVTPAAISAIEAFVEPDLRHHWLTPDTFVSDASRLREARSLYAALRQDSSGDADSDLRRAERLARRLFQGPAWRRIGARYKLLPRAEVVAPVVLSEFPTDLTAPGARSFGIHLDGWAERESYFGLSGGGAAEIVVRADVLPCPGQALDVLVNGRSVASLGVEVGSIELRVPIPPCREIRHVQLRWAKAMQLGAPDKRTVAALIRRLGVAAPGEAVALSGSGSEREPAGSNGVRRTNVDGHPITGEAVDDPLAEVGSDVASEVRT